MQVTSSTSADRFAAATTTDPTGATTTPTTTTGNKTLGESDFLKLLAVQFQQQDPMKPTDDTAFIAQMAQFTSLSQSSSTLAQITQLSASQQVATANSYIGRQVTLDDGTNPTVTGVVSGVQISNGTPQIMVGGTAYPLSEVVAVEPAPASSSSSTTNNTTNP